MNLSLHAVNLSFWGSAEGIVDRDRISLINSSAILKNARGARVLGFIVEVTRETLPLGSTDAEVDTIAADCSGGTHASFCKVTKVTEVQHITADCSVGTHTLKKSVKTASLREWPGAMEFLLACTLFLLRF